MAKKPDFEIFLATAPGLEAALAAEAREKRVRDAKPVRGGVTGKGGWDTVWRANLELRGASRVLARIASFRADHLAELDKRSREVPWATILRPDVACRVEVSCTRSRIYHTDAAAERVERAIRVAIGAPQAEDAPVTVMARIEKDICTLSVDTSGELLHKRGFKEAVGKAPMRENMAAMFLRQCGYAGREPVVDPMCGSGTFVIEAAEIASGLKPGRARQFAFEKLATFDKVAWETMRGASTPLEPSARFFGRDHDAGAIRMSRENAERAGVAAITDFQEAAVQDLAAPEGPPGLVIVNPPYGDRVGEKARLTPLYRALGKTLKQRFRGWRVGLITNDATLAEATGLVFAPTSTPVLHGGLRVWLYQSGPL